VLLGVVLVLIIDNSVTAFMAPRAVKRAIVADEHARREASARAAAAGAGDAEREAAGLPACAAGDPFHHHHVHTSPQAAALDAVAADEAAAATAAASAAAADLERGGGANGNGKNKSIVVHHNPKHHDHEDHDDHDLDHHQSSSLPHTHQCLRSASAQHWQMQAAAAAVGGAKTPRERATGAAALRAVKLSIGAYAMELGCIFHSFIIGMGLGVVVSGRGYVATMLGALTIHQALEGLSLGSVLARTSFSRLHQAIMVLTYSLTTPIGIAVGIAITGAYDPVSRTALAVQGTLNGLSGGMLLHIALFQIVAEEFSREDLLARPKLRMGLYSSLLLGAGLMCILAIWA
jgi:solute carrier family 39 (zinc transporter), member 1/2/3